MVWCCAPQFLHGCTNAFNHVIKVDEDKISPHWLQDHVFKCHGFAARVPIPQLLLNFVFLHNLSWPWLASYGLTFLFALSSNCLHFPLVPVTCAWLHHCTIGPTLPWPLKAVVWRGHLWYDVVGSGCGVLFTNSCTASTIKYPVVAVVGSSLFFNYILQFHCLPSLSSV